MQLSLLDKIAYWTLWFALETGRLTAAALPLRLTDPASRAFAGIGFYLFRGFRERSMKNLSLALKDRLDTQERTVMTRKTLRNVFCDLVEIGRALSRPPEELREEIPFVGEEHLKAALAKGHGVIVLSAHLGNFFLLGSRLAIEGYPAYVLVNPPKSRSLREIFDHYRLKIGQRTIPARPRQAAFGEMVRVLRENRIAIVIADEYRSGEGIFAPFFGRTVLARRGPATLALRTRAAVIPATLARGAGNKLTLIIEPEIKMSRSGNIQTDVRDNTVRITQWVERIVRAHPDQWNWMNVRWQEPPAGALAEKEHGYERLA